MVTHLETENQTLLPFCVKSRAGYTIHLPLPPARSAPVSVGGPQWKVCTVKQAISRVLNEGRIAIDILTGNKIAIYRRGLHQGQVRALERFAKRSGVYGLHGGWMHISMATGRSDGDWSKMAYFGLIEALPKELAKTIVPPDADGKQSPRGWWRVTDLGRRWLARQAKVPRQIAILSKEFLGFVDASDLITRDEANDRPDVEGLQQRAAEGVA